MVVSRAMLDALADLEAAFVEVDHPWARHTIPGPTVDQIRSEVESAGLVLPDELVELWSWRSGSAPDDHQNGWMLPGEFRIPVLADSIRFRSDLLADEMLRDDWYMKTDWLVALEAGPIRFWAHTKTEKAGSVLVTPVDLWDAGGSEVEAVHCTVPITTVIRDMARMLREKHWGLYDNPYTKDDVTMWMRNPEIGDVSDHELGYMWAYPVG